MRGVYNGPAILRRRLRLAVRDLMDLERLADEWGCSDVANAIARGRSDLQDAMTRVTAIGGKGS